MDHSLKIDRLQVSAGKERICCLILFTINRVTAKTGDSIARRTNKRYNRQNHMCVWGIYSVVHTRTTASKSPRMAFQRLSTPKN